MDFRKAALAVTLAALAAPAALAQQAPTAPKASTPAPAAKPAAPAAQPAQQPAQAAQPGQAQAPAANYMYDPWVKQCIKNEQTQNRQVCMLGKLARLENGQPIASVQILETEKEDRKSMRLMFPLGMMFRHGTRIVLDSLPAMSEPYLTCTQEGCFAEYQINGEFINLMKKGKTLTVQGITAVNFAISPSMPLNDFAKVYDGPPTDPKVIEENRKKIQDAVEKMAEARRKVDPNAAPGTPPAAGAPAAPAAPAPAAPKR